MIMSVCIGMGGKMGFLFLFQTCLCVYLFLMSSDSNSSSSNLCSVSINLRVTSDEHWIGSLRLTFTIFNPFSHLTQLTNLLMMAAKSSELAVVVFAVVVVARWAVVIFLKHSHGTSSAIAHLLLMFLEES